jgi:hypothetical protein
VLNALQHAALVVGVLDLLHLDHLRLLEHLYGIEAAVVAALHEVDAPEAAGPKRALQRKVRQRILTLGLAQRRLRRRLLLGQVLQQLGLRGRRLQARLLLEQAGERPGGGLRLRVRRGRGGERGRVVAR